MGKRKASERTEHQLHSTEPPSHARYFGMTWPPNEARTHDGQVPPAPPRLPASDTLLPYLGDRVSAHVIRVADERCRLVHGAFGACPIVNDETADEHEPLDNRLRHSVEKPFC